MLGAGAGSFAFGDADYAKNVQDDGHMGEWQQALWVLTEVGGGCVRVGRAR
jgi:hypothetical protein